MEYEMLTRYHWYVDEFLIHKTTTKRIVQSFSLVILKEHSAFMCINFLIAKDAKAKSGHDYARNEHIPFLCYTSSSWSGSEHQGGCILFARNDFTCK